MEAGLPGPFTFDVEDVMDQSLRFGTRVCGDLMPSVVRTDAEQGADGRSGYGTNRTVFRNPRGNQNYYALYHTTAGGSKIEQEYSTDGTTWSNTPQVVIDSPPTHLRPLVFDVKIHDTGSILEIFVAATLNTAYPAGAAILYCYGYIGGFG